MARKVRLEHPGAGYHVMNRADRREVIFRGEADRQRCIDALGEACAKTGWRLQAEHPKTDRRKARIARRLRQETTTCLPAGR
jgi:REP element-mobilizing transposase RayT